MTSFAGPPGPRSIGTPFLRILSHKHFYKHLKTLKTRFFLEDELEPELFARLRTWSFFFSSFPQSPRFGVPGRDWCQCSGACMCGRTLAARVQTTKQPWSVAKGKWLPMGPNFGPHIYPQLQSPVPDLLSQALQKNYFVCSSIPPSFNIGKSGRGRVWKWARGSWA